MNPSEYNEYRRRSIEEAAVYQDFVVDCFLNILKVPITMYTSKAYQHGVGESACGIEIKHDKRFGGTGKEKATGNLWIELKEKAVPRAGAYADSGIMRNDNSWLYVIGNYDIIFIFAKRLLIGLSKTARYRQLENGTKTSVGFLLPKDDAMKYAAQVLTPNASEKIAKSVMDAHEFTMDIYRSMVEGNARQMRLFPDPEEW